MGSLKNHVRETMCLREIRKPFSMSEFHGRKTVNPHLSRTSRPIGISIFPFETTIFFTNNTMKMQ